MRVMLRAYSVSGDPNELTALVGTEPTGTIRVGDMAPDGRHTVSRSGWWIDTEREAATLDDVWAETAGALALRSGVQTSIERGWSWEFLVSISPPPVESVVFTPSMLRALSTMGIELCVVAS